MNLTPGNLRGDRVASGIPGSGLARVRWLGRRVLTGPVAAVSGDVPTPQLVSACLSPAVPAVRDHVLWWVARPDADSTFEARTRWLRWLPGALLLRVLLALGYDGLVYPRAGAILGHVFFQRRGAALCGFSTAVNEGFDGKGYSVVMVLDYLAYASQVPGITRARIGRGHTTVTRRLLARIKTHEESLGWRTSADGWVTFSVARGACGGEVRGEHAAVPRAA